MFEHCTKTSGDLAVFKAQLDMFEKGYLILNPMTEHAPFDIVGYKDNKFIRVQVKYRSIDSSGCVLVQFFSRYTGTQGNIRKPVDKTQIDYYCIYIPELDRCFYIDPKDFETKKVHLRVSPPKNNQKKGVSLLDDYSKEI